MCCNIFFAYNLNISKNYNLLRVTVLMATNHQKGGVSVINLTDDSLNESISSNYKDKEIAPFIGYKTDSNKNIGAYSSDLSIGKDKT